MALALAGHLATGLAGYGLLGLVFAAVWLAAGRWRVAHAPAPMTWPARLLITPGLVLLWPLLAWRWSSRLRS